MTEMFIIFLIATSRAITPICWYSCSNCSTNQYDGCTQCITSDRGLNGTPVNGTCFCDEGLQDTGTECLTKQDDQALQTQSVFLILIGILLLVNFFGAGIHQMTFHTINIFQITALLNIIDVPYPYPFDNQLKSLNYFYIYPLIPNSVMNDYTRVISNYSKVADVSNQNINNSFKLRQQGFSYCFALNEFRMIVISSVALALMFIVYKRYETRNYRLSQFFQENYRNVIIRMWDIFLMPTVIFIIWQFFHPWLSSVLDYASLIIALFVTVVFFCTYFLLYEITNNQKVQRSSPIYKTIYDDLPKDDWVHNNYLFEVSSFKIVIGILIALFYDQPRISYRVVTYGSLFQAIYTGFVVSFENVSLLVYNEKLHNFIYATSYALMFLLYLTLLEYLNLSDQFQFRLSKVLLLVQVSFQLLTQILIFVTHYSLLTKRIQAGFKFIRNVDQIQTPTSLSNAETIEMRTNLMGQLSSMYQKDQVNPKQYLNQAHQKYTPASNYEQTTQFS